MITGEVRKAILDDLNSQGHSIYPQKPSNVSPTFVVGGVPIYGRIILAPMDGLSDMPTRTIARRFGSAMSYTEFLNTIDIHHKNRDTNERLSFREEERPIVFQLLDSDIDRLINAAIELEDRKPDIFDINLGCPARSVSGRGAGAGLLKKPGHIARLFSELTKVVKVPVTAKIRLGWDDTCLNYMEIARIIEDNGGALIAVHGRTRAQGYSGTALWEPIGEVKQAVKIPVLANGDVKTKEDIEKVIAITGCDGIMVGRGALGNPWIFSERNKIDVPLTENVQTIHAHLELMMEFFGKEFGNMVFRKHLKAYLKGYGIPRDEISNLMTCPDAESVYEGLDLLIAKYGQK